jgi:hypothetical protein
MQESYEGRYVRFFTPANGNRIIAVARRDKEPFFAFDERIY